MDYEDIVVVGSVGGARSCTPGKAAARPFSPLKFQNGIPQVHRRKVRPALRQKDEFREGALPEQKIRKPLFSARANQQVHFRRAATLHFGKQVAKCLAGKVGYFVKLAGRLVDRLSRRIVDRQSQVQRLALRGQRFGIGNRRSQARGQAIAPPDDAQANAFFEAVGSLRLEVFLQYPRMASTSTGGRCQFAEESANNVRCECRGAARTG